MKVSLKTRICTVAAVGTIVLAGAAVAQAGEKPDGMTAQQYKAEVIRGDALNKRYGLGPYSLLAQGGPRPAGLTVQQWQAELIRGDALNKHYGLGNYAAAVDSSVRRTVDAGPADSVASGGFDWGDAGIGAGAVIGLALLALGMAVAVREARRPQMTTTS